VKQPDIIIRLHFVQAVVARLILERGCVGSLPVVATKLAGGSKCFTAPPTEMAGRQKGAAGLFAGKDSAALRALGGAPARATVRRLWLPAED